MSLPAPRLRRERLAELSAAELAGVAAGDGPPTGDCKSRLFCEPIIRDTAFCETER